MASAIPAAIGVGGSLIGGAMGKGEQKKQRQFAERQWQEILPMLRAQNSATQEALGWARGIIPGAQNAIQTVFNQATGTFEPLMKDYRQMLADATSSQNRFNAEGDALMGEGKRLTGLSEAEMVGAATGLSDLENYYRPFLQDGARAIEKFLPSQATLQKLMAGDFANINQGFKSASENIANFAPRGGGRVSTLANADINRQQQLTQTSAQGRQAYGQQGVQNFFQAGEGKRNALTGKAQIGQGLGQLGLGKIGAGQQSKQMGIADFGAKSQVGLNQLGQALQALGLAGGQAGNLASLGQGILGAGLSGGQQATNLYNAQANRAYGSQPPQNNSKGLGGFLVDLFNSPDSQNWLKGMFGGGKGSTGMSFDDFMKD